MQPARRLLPDPAVVAAASRAEASGDSSELAAAVVALLAEGWTVDDIAVVHRLSVHDLAVLDASRDRPGRDLHP